VLQRILKISYFIVPIIILLFIIGGFLSKEAYQYRETKETKENLESAILFSPSSKENLIVGGIFGVIKEVKNQEILVESSDNLIFPQPKELIGKKWIVKIDKNTKILERKSDNFSRDETPEGFGMTAPFKDYNITIKDLKIGDYVSVVSIENIVDTDEFLAKLIIKFIFSASVQ